MMMLFVALLAIGATALAPSITFRIRRDREEEMIHRGVQYSRAIRHYVKKFGRYPTRIEELENTNNLRFLRKRYKDPITGQDFKLLHVGDVQLTSTAGIAGAAALGAAVASAGAQGTRGMLGGATAQAAQAALAAATATVGGAGAVTASGTGAVTDNSAQDAGQDNGGQADKPKDQGQSETGSKQLSSQVFGGGPIVGVASTSKALSIREFNHKNHYNQWQFIYDPSMDRGGLITTPAQPPLQVSQTVNQQNSSGQNSSGMGSFGGMQSPPPVQPTQQPPQ
jgi:type II secretory pathway pseudopilin PulG